MRSRRSRSEAPPPPSGRAGLRARRVPSTNAAENLPLAVKNATLP